MGLPRPPSGGKLICGILAADEQRISRALEELSRRVGRIDVRSDIMHFDFSDYYADEMGERLLRQFVAFEGCVVPEQLVATKLATNEIELRLCDSYNLPTERRPVNLDPGYITLGKLILATTKDHAHRIYLAYGIFGEVTLRYSQHNWHPWPWTQPDYASGAYFSFFTEVRKRLKAELVETARDDSGIFPSIPPIA